MSDPWDWDYVVSGPVIPLRVPTPIDLPLPFVVVAYSSLAFWDHPHNQRPQMIVSRFATEVQLRKAFPRARRPILDTVPPLPWLG